MYSHALTSLASSLGQFSAGQFSIAQLINVHRLFLIFTGRSRNLDLAHFKISISGNDAVSAGLMADQTEPGFGPGHAKFQIRTFLSGGREIHDNQDIRFIRTHPKD